MLSGRRGTERPSGNSPYRSSSESEVGLCGRAGPCVRPGRSARLWPRVRVGGNERRRPTERQDVAARRGSQVCQVCGPTDARLESSAGAALTPPLVRSRARDDRFVSEWAGGRSSGVRLRGVVFAIFTIGWVIWMIRTQNRTAGVARCSAAAVARDFRLSGCCQPRSQRRRDPEYYVESRLVPPPGIEPGHMV